MNDSKIRLLGIVLYLSVTSFFISGCMPVKGIPYTLIDVNPLPLPAPDGYYQNIAWLRSDLLALEHLDSLQTNNWDTRLMIYNLVTGESYLLPDKIPSDCRETRYGRFERLPNGQLGYLWECLPFKGVSRDFRLHMWDLETMTDQELYRYPIPFEATAFSFAPAMDRWLQEQSGDGIFNKLHLVEQGKEPLRLLENSFARAGLPTWLPDGRILFAGTPQLPKTKPNLFSGLPSLARQMDAPWNIYLTDINALKNESVGKAQIVLAGIVGMRSGLAVSPDGRKVAFLGVYDNHSGLWVYSMTSGALVRLWDGWGVFNWSPDGTALMVLVREPTAKFFAGHPARIALPESLLN